MISTCLMNWLQILVLNWYTMKGNQDHVYTL